MSGVGSALPGGISDENSTRTSKSDSLLALAQRTRFLQQALHVLFRAAERNKKAHALFFTDGEDQAIGLRDAPGSFWHNVDPERLRGKAVKIHNVIWHSYLRYGLI